MYQRTQSSMMSASNERRRYMGSRAIGSVIRRPLEGGRILRERPADAPEPALVTGAHGCQTSLILKEGRPFSSWAQSPSGCCTDTREREGRRACTEHTHFGGESVYRCVDGRVLAEIYPKRAGSPFGGCCHTIACMAAEAFIQCRVASATKAARRAAAHRQPLTELAQ